MIGGSEVTIWFTPSFNIKTDDKELEFQLRELDFDVYDLWSGSLRNVKATKGIREAYLVIDRLSDLVPELGIEILEAPELPSELDKGTEENPALH